MHASLKAQCAVMGGKLSATLSEYASQCIIRNTTKYIGAFSTVQRGRLTLLRTRKRLLSLMWQAERTAVSWDPTANDGEKSRSSSVTISGEGLLHH